MSEAQYAPLGSLREFHVAGNVKRWVDCDEVERKQLIRLRMELLRQEFNELMDELLDAQNGSGDLSKIAKESADLKYVTYAVDDLFDIPGQRVFQEVHRSNMSKVDSRGIIQRDNFGKILKGPNYRPPHLDPILHGTPSLG